MRLNGVRTCILCLISNNNNNIRVQRIGTRLRLKSFPNRRRCRFEQRIKQF